MSTVNDQNTNANAGTDETTDETIDILVSMAAMPISELDRTSFEDKSRINSTKRAAEFFSGFERTAGSWLESHRKNTDATFQGALWILRLRSEVLDSSGHPYWSARRAINAWHVVYANRVPAMYNRMGFTADERDDFDSAVRKAQSRHAIQKIAIVEYLVNTENNLGAETMPAGKDSKDKITLHEALAIMTGDDTDARKKLYGVRWPAKLVKLVQPHVSRQVVGGNGENKDKRQAGFEGIWTYFGPQEENDGGNGNGSSSRGNVGQETYESATKKLVAFPTSDHWNPTYATDSLHETLTAYSPKLEKGKRMKNRAGVIARLRAIEKHAGTLADMMEEVGKSDKPSPADVQKLYYADEK